MRFDVSMADASRVNVQQSSEYLESDELDVEIGHPLLLVLLDEVVQIAVVVRHYDVEVLLALLVGDVRS